MEIITDNQFSLFKIAFNSISFVKSKCRGRKREEGKKELKHLNKLKHSSRLYLFILIDRLNMLAGLPSQSYKLAAMRELHVGIPGNGDGWDTSTYLLDIFGSIVSVSEI